MGRTDQLIKISEMAAMHGISRQTLILYDKNGLLKPAYVSESGYRYYSLDQIPYLRQICLLKEMGITLAEIRTYLEDRTPQAMTQLLCKRSHDLDEQAKKLMRQREQLSELSELLADIPTKEKSLGIPFVCHLPQRYAVFAPYPKQDMDVRQLHLALMEAWTAVLAAEMLPSRGFGSLLLTNPEGTDLNMARAGSFVLLPSNASPARIQGASVITIPEGDYVCMYKYAMPYNVEPARELLAWTHEHGFDPAGEIADCCILDTAFRREPYNEDFCRLELRIK